MDYGVVLAGMAVATMHYELSGSSLRATPTARHRTWHRTRCGLTYAEWLDLCCLLRDLGLIVRTATAPGRGNCRRYKCDDGNGRYEVLAQSNQPFGLAGTLIAARSGLVGPSNFFHGVVRASGMFS